MTRRASAWVGAPVGKLPWIPTARQWVDILIVAAEEAVRNRMMLALAYDAALRREERCALRTDDLDPAHRTLRIRAETTKNRLDRIVPYSAPTGVLLSDYLAHRARLGRAERIADSVGVPPQSRAAVEPVDAVDGGATDRTGRRCAAVLHAHHPASVFDGSGPDGLRSPCDRDLPGASRHGLNAAIYRLSRLDLADNLGRDVDHGHPNRAW